MTSATSVAAEATMNLPGSARISISLGNRRSSSALSIRASSRNGRTLRSYSRRESSADVEQFQWKPLAAASSMIAAEMASACT